MEYARVKQESIFSIRCHVIFFTRTHFFFAGNNSLTLPTVTAQFFVQSCNIFLLNYE